MRKATSLSASEIFNPSARSASMKAASTRKMRNAISLSVSRSLACLIHIFEDNKGLLCYKHVVKTMFAATKEASECLKIAQHSVCCSQEFFASLSWPNLISERGVPMAELCC